MDHDRSFRKSFPTEMTKEEKIMETDFPVADVESKLSTKQSQGKFFFLHIFQPIVKICRIIKRR